MDQQGAAESTAAKIVHVLLKLEDRRRDGVENFLGVWVPVQMCHRLKIGISEVLKAVRCCQSCKFSEVKCAIFVLKIFVVEVFISDLGKCDRPVSNKGTVGGCLIENVLTDKRTTALD